MFLTVGDLTFHVAVDGPPGAPALVLLHSLGTNLHVWDPQAAALSRMFRVIRPDLRGHGLTTATQGAYSMEMLAGDLVSVLDALGVAKAHIGGISIGGMVAQQFAAQYPARALSLLLCDTAMVIPPASSWADRAQLVRAQGIGVIEDAVIARWVTPEFIDAAETQGLRAMLRRTTVEGYAGCADAIAAADLSASTAKLSLPFLVMVGDQDLATPPEAAMALYDALFSTAALPHKMVMIADAAHIPTFEQPDVIIAAILEFLKPQTHSAFDDGMVVRKQVLGEAHVAHAGAGATDFDRDFQKFITETAWGRIWTRPGLDRRTRSLLTLAVTAALGREEEFSLHVRASKNTGTARADIAETLMHTAIYAGVPAANSAFRTAKAIFKEEDS